MESAIMAPGSTRLKVRGKNNSGRNSISRLLTRNHNSNKNNRNSIRTNSLRNNSNQRHYNNCNKNPKCCAQIVDNAAFVNINNGNDSNSDSKIIFSGDFTR